MAAEAAAAHLAGPGLDVLDVGSGAEPWSLAIAQRQPTCRVTAIGQPATLNLTQGAVAAAGCQAQFQYQPGDVLRLDLDRTAYDLVVAGGVCRLFDAEANRILLRRCFRALRPGGMLAIVEPLPSERPDGPCVEGADTPGRAYPFSTYVGWLRDAGFADVDRVDLALTPPVSLVTARRPGAD